MISAQYHLVRLLNRLGLTVRRLPSNQEARRAGEGGDPVTADYDAHLRGQAIFDITVSDARAFHSLALPMQEELHPFVAAIARAMNANDAEAAIRPVLTEYYAAVCPRSAVEAMGCDPAEAPGLRDVPATGYLLPWWSRSVDDIVRGRDRAMRLVGLQKRMKLSLEDGLTAFGPISQAKLDLEVARLAGLVESLRRSGFVAQDKISPMRVTALRKDREYRWLVEEGQHRFAAAAAMGISSIPAAVAQIVRFEDAVHWPKVAGGIVSLAGAQDMFLRIFDGRPARICDPWIARASGT